MALQRFKLFVAAVLVPLVVVFKSPEVFACWVQNFTKLQPLLRWHKRLQQAWYWIAHCKQGKALWKKRSMLAGFLFTVIISVDMTVAQQPLGPIIAYNSQTLRAYGRLFHIQSNCKHASILSHRDSCRMAGRRELIAKNWFKKAVAEPRGVSLLGVGTTLATSCIKGEKVAERKTLALTHSLDDPDGDLLSEEEFEETVALPDNLFPVEEVSEATVEKETKEKYPRKPLHLLTRKTSLSLLSL